MMLLFKPYFFRPVSADSEGRGAAQLQVGDLLLFPPPSSRPPLGPALGSGQFEYLTGRKRKAGLHMDVRWGHVTPE